MNLLLHILGVDDVSGRWYAFWSGFGSDITEFAALAALIGAIKRLNCDVHRCWRWGRLPALVDGVSHHVCRKHHPTGAPTAARLNETRDT